MNHDELIGKYLDGELTDQETIEFNSRVNSDSAFQKLVKEYEDLHKGITLASRNKILDEIKIAKDTYLDEQQKFEQDLIQSLKLKERQKISGEIESANKISLKSPRMINFFSRPILAMAASILVLLVFGWLIFFKSTNVNDDQEAVLILALEKIAADAQKVGLADPELEYKHRLDTIFSHLEHNNIDQAMLENERLYRNRNYDYAYFETRGIIHLKNKDWAKAKREFQKANQAGESCLSKVLFAILNGDQKSKLLAKDKSCISNPMVAEIIDAMK